MSTLTSRRETTKTAHEPKRPRPKRPINFRYDHNGPQLRPKRPIPKSKTAHDDPTAVEALKKWDGGRSSRLMSLWKGLNPSPAIVILGVRVCNPRENFRKKGVNLWNLVHFREIMSSKVGLKIDGIYRPCNAV